VWLHEVTIILTIINSESKKEKWNFGNCQVQHINTEMQTSFTTEV